MVRGAPGEGSCTGRQNISCWPQSDWRLVLDGKVCEKVKRRSRLCGCPCFGGSEKGVFQDLPSDLTVE